MAKESEPRSKSPTALELLARAEEQLPLTHGEGGGYGARPNDVIYRLAVNRPKVREKEGEGNEMKGN
jgi:hypothetical protein